MKLCRYDEDRLGVVRDGKVYDATAALSELPLQCWPLALGDPLIARLSSLRAVILQAAQTSRPVALESVTLKSPVANPTKVIAAPVNYRRHLDEARTERAIHHGQQVLAIADVGVFLKATSSIVGCGEGVALRHAGRRNDHEVELVAIIGTAGSQIDRADALGYVAGYCIGLDMTVRGTEDRSLRKSIDSYTVLGPYLVTADELTAPGALDLHIDVNGERRQSSNTRHMVWDLPTLIAYASSYYTLYPGDVIMTGTPEGVGPVQAGDVMTCSIEGIGTMTVTVRNAR